MSETLPEPDKPFGGKIGVTTADSKPDKPAVQKPPAGAPNVVVVLLDVGHETSVARGEPLPAGKMSVKVVFDYHDGGRGKGGAARLGVNGHPVAEGRDTGSPAGPYRHGFPFTGEVRRIEIEMRSALDAPSKQAMTEGQRVGAMRAQ